MENDAQSLVAASTSLHRVVPAGQSSDFTRQLFASFRDVFSAENQPERAIFWIEESRGQAFLRHVVNRKRTRKSDDLLVGKITCDLDAIRVLIGNFAAGSSLTSVRWELYADFALTNLVERGRFDLRDLLPTIDDLSVLTRKGLALNGDWDFDNIILTHKCPNCKGVCNRTSVLYVPHFPCEQCGEPAGRDQSGRIINRLLLKFRQRQERLALYPAGEESGAFSIQQFVDPAPNSVAYWWITVQAGAAMDDEKAAFYGGQQEMLHAIVRQSLFKFMTIHYLREGFKKFLMETSTEDWTMFIGQVWKFGELLQSGSLQRTREALLGCSPQYVQIALPQLINEVILNHACRFQDRAAVIQN